MLVRLRRYPQERGRSSMLLSVLVVMVVAPVVVSASVAVGSRSKSGASQSSAEPR
jgi:hypothetical protein